MPAALDHVADLVSFIAASPSSFHAAAEAARRLRAAGFAEQDESAPWNPGPGGHYLVRDGAVVAWRVPAGAGPATAYRIVGAHTDSPGFKLKPRPDLGGYGWQQLGVEIYGGPLLNSWLDRELGLAGRVVLAGGGTRLVRTEAIMRIPQLAIHLDRERNDGLRLDKQLHTTPVWGVGRPGVRILDHLAGLVGSAAGGIQGYDLMAYDTAAPAVFGVHQEFLAAARLDNLSGVHAGLTALISSPGGDQVEVLAAFDHEELGSASRSGASGPLLTDVLTRVSAGLGADLDQRHRALSHSWCVSVDAGHAVHPNYPQRHDPANHPVLNGGPLAQDQREPAVRDGRPGCRDLAAGLPRGGREHSGIRVEQPRALRLDHRAVDGHPARHPYRRRRTPGAVHALGARTGRNRRPARAGSGDRGLSRRRPLGWSPVALTIGIVGLPNAGKSTLFNALTRNDVLAANYPFATIEPNVGVVGVPDPRLAVLSDLFHSERIVPATVSFVDIAGIVRGASQGEGMGNAFLSHIREADAICEVTRVFTDPDVTHVDGAINPASDIETISTELILADLQTIERALPRLEKEARINKAKVSAAAALREAQRRAERRPDDLRGPGSTAEPLRELFLLTAKPFLYVFNCDSDELADEALKERMRALVAPAEAIFLDAKIESELVEMEPDEAREFLAEMDVDEPGLDVLARVGFDTLGLQTYLTAGPKESRAWTIPKGATAPEAAGVIHTDFQKGFIKAEIVGFDDLVAAGSMQAAKAKGKVRLEGKDYVMADGDVVEFRFNV